MLKRAAEEATVAPERPEAREMDAAHQLLAHFAAKHGLSNLRHGDGPGEVIVDVEEGRTYFDVVSFEDDVGGTFGWRPDVVPSGAPDANPGRPIGAADTNAA